MKRKKNMKMKYYVCRRIRLLTFLQEKGFQYIMMEKDKYNPNYNIWLFKDSQMLRDAIEEYYSNK